MDVTIGRTDLPATYRAHSKGYEYAKASTMGIDRAIHTTAIASKGLSPSADIAEHIGKRRKFEIHHINPINEGGSVYDISNLTLLTPKQHIDAHSKKGETP
ncbi:HNH endonuclease signature motif containing protein [Pseudomonas sp. RIT-PI-r]|uniref:HNH endonuclease signature motif containing protein n=1 Tax=Pseudomonas sp. RIT-PI-r TaxID=1699620 RepID=UPI0015A6117C|nr:HNH endonuclease signature motif containing protein [Pseudomonas sp. RIT-PI-r]